MQIKSEGIAIGSSQSIRLVQALAEQTKQPLDTARRAYESQFHRLESGARLRTYLPVLAARRAREILMPG